MYGGLGWCATMNKFSLDHQFSESSAAVANATIRIIASRGLDAVSVREVAKQSGFAAGSVQYHAPNKETLLAHAFIRSIQRQNARVVGAEVPDDEIEAWVVRLSELLPLGGERLEDAACGLPTAPRQQRASGLPTFTVRCSAASSKRS